MGHGGQAEQAGHPVEDDDGCGTLVGYVDDGAYSYSSPYPYVLSQVLTGKYNKLENWMNANKLVINPLDGDGRQKELSEEEACGHQGWRTHH